MNYIAFSSLYPSNHFICIDQNLLIKVEKKLLKNIINNQNNNSLKIIKYENLLNISMSPDKVEIYNKKEQNKNKKTRGNIKLIFRSIPRQTTYIPMDQN